MPTLPAEGPAVGNDAAAIRFRVGEVHQADTHAPGEGVYGRGDLDSKEE
jgi:hypothetical protein